MGLFDNHVNSPCCKCGTDIMLRPERYAKLKQTGEDFWCPNGHQQRFVESDNDRLKKHITRLEGELQRMTEARARWQGWYEEEQNNAAAARRRINSLRGVITRMKKNNRTP